MKLKLVSFSEDFGRMGIPNAYIVGFDENSFAYITQSDLNQEDRPFILDPMEVTFDPEENQEYIVLQKIRETKPMPEWKVNDLFSGGMGNLGVYIGEFDVKVNAK